MNSDSQAEVILRHAGAELARVILPPGEYLVGRGAEAQVRADTPLLSRKHARLTLRPGHVLIEDLGSSNGTFVGDQPAAGAMRLFPNQRVRLGDVELEIRPIAAAADPAAGAPPAQSAIERLLPGDVLRSRRYSVGGVVARGGMGAILDARQMAIGRTVAMKVMLEAGEEADVVRFIDEAKITGQLEHPNIVPIYEIGVDDQGQVFYTMKMVRGITLRKVLELLADGVEATVKKFPLPALLTVFQKACDAVAFAHAKGVIHRDLKPENIMLGDFGSVLVMDWGLAKRLKSGGGTTMGHAPRAASPFDAPPPAAQTMAGTVMGTPQYMAPEQARGEVETMDQRADIYALGGILFHILHLRPSVSGDDAWAIVRKVARGEVEWTCSAGGSSPAGALRQRTLHIPDSLLAVCRKAMALEPAARYASVEELQGDLTAYQNGFATSAENAGWFKRTSLAIKRNKTASLAAALVLVLGATLGTKAIVEGRRAALALAHLKQNAPAMLALAESEAVAQRFDSELEKADLALRLDPELAAAYWRRAWAFVALGRFGEAAAAVKTAVEHDRANAAQFIGILPQLQKLAALPGDDAARFAPENILPLFDFLNAHGIRGEAGALIAHLKLSVEKRLAIGRERLNAACGSASGLGSLPNGLIQMNFTTSKLSSLEQLRGVPFDVLLAGSVNLQSVEALRGLPIVELAIGGNRDIKDLSPLAGMPLRKLVLSGCENVTDLSPLRGMPLEDLGLDGSGVADLSPLKGAPLRSLSAGLVTDFRGLSQSPLETLIINGGGHVVNFSGLAGVPLKTLTGTSAVYADLTPLLRVPTLERLTTGALPDRLAPLRHHPGLKFINWKSQGFRAVAEFWPAFEAQQAAAKK